MAQSSDEIIKREIQEKVGDVGNLKLWVFPQTSRDDQKIFPEGLTFGFGGLAYGSCDACWVKEGLDWKNPFNGEISKFTPVVVLEGTDAPDRGSSGDAQYQRFHHALGAVKCGLIGVYYLRKGKCKVQPDLYRMACCATACEKGTYLILEDLDELKLLLSGIDNPKKTKNFIEKKIKYMNGLFSSKFKKLYKTWGNFSRKRSTILKGRYIIKYSARKIRDFTDGSQRAGHIALGEMYLTKYFFPNKFFYYLWPRMTKKELAFLDEHKKEDKEWKILRNEPNVKIITLGDLNGVPLGVKRGLLSIKNKPFNGSIKRKYNIYMKLLRDGFELGTISIKKGV